MIILCDNGKDLRAARLAPSFVMNVWMPGGLISRKGLKCLKMVIFLDGKAVCDYDISYGVFLGADL